ncbi:hypothetical protein MtrunA17_Chr1g0182441 [Medicago truncatula]|uniref:Uncharacterized protein n=1 Tax=Medicago truncatula TaxID=3880 RepID=A0A396JUM4_MEDTR|nr:hypothetical protein MtrunA17_Chr1g0182441 [Medicago truncatula]
MKKKEIEDRIPDVSSFLSFYLVYHLLYNCEDPATLVIRNKKKGMFVVLR